MFKTFYVNCRMHKTKSLEWKSHGDFIDMENNTSHVFDVKQTTVLSKMATIEIVIKAKQRGEASSAL